ncbi:hypothetical protein, partial [Mycobacterium tuberculosis]
LLRRRQRAVEGDDVGLSGERLTIKALLRAANFGRAGQEDQDVAAVVVFLHEQGAQGAGDDVVDEALAALGVELLLVDVRDGDGI